MNDFNFNSFFDKVYVISGKDCTERRLYIAQVLDDLNINFEFFDAIMGNNLTSNEIDEVYDEELAKNHVIRKRALSKPEIGCALSHFRIYKKIIKHNYERTLIFEDDAKPVYKNLANINNIIDELPTDWDLLYLGTLNHDEKASINYKLKLIFYYPFACAFTERIQYKYRHLCNFYPKKYSKSLKRAGYQTGNHAYAISRKGAEKNLRYHHKIVAPIDNLLSEMIMERKLNSYLTRKKMFVQNKGKFKSLIHNSRKKMNRK